MSGHQIPISHNMPALKLFPTYTEEQLTQIKIAQYYQFDAEADERKTRNSTFSKASDGRDEIQKDVCSYYEKAFA